MRGQHFACIAWTIWPVPARLTLSAWRLGRLCHRDVDVITVNPWKQPHSSHWFNTAVIHESLAVSFSVVCKWVVMRWTSALKSALLNVATGPSSSLRHTVLAFGTNECKKEWSESKMQTCDNGCCVESWLKALLLYENLILPIGVAMYRRRQQQFKKSDSVVTFHFRFITIFTSPTKTHVG